MDSPAGELPESVTRDQTWLRDEAMADGLQDEESASDIHRFIMCVNATLDSPPEVSDLLVTY